MFFSSLRAGITIPTFKLVNLETLVNPSEVDIGEDIPHLTTIRHQPQKEQLVGPLCISNTLAIRLEELVQTTVNRFSKYEVPFISVSPISFSSLNAAMITFVEEAPALLPSPPITTL